MDTKRVDLNLLVALEALLAEQNVTKAAARLHLSQPAMSAQLARLRDLFGDALLTPARRGMVPTAKALELREPLRAALVHARAVVGDHRVFEPAAASLTVSVACSDYLQTAIVKPLLRPLGARAPGIRLALRNMSPADLELQMTLGDVDIGLLDLASAPPGLRARRLYSEYWVLVARRDHPRLQDRPSLNDFLKLAFVVVSLAGGGFHTPVDDALAVRGLQRNVVLSASTFLFALDVIAHSDLVALMPARLMRHRRDRLRVLDCPLPVKGYEVGMVWHERTHGHLGQRWLRDLIGSVAGA